MSADFDAWIETLHLGEPDAGGDVGTLPVGAMAFLREVFDSAGPVSQAELRAVGQQREWELAEQAVGLVLADVHRTTALRPVVEIRRIEDDILAVTYGGSYQTPAMYAIRNPEATCEVADNLRDHVVEDLWSPWPVCPAHGSALDPCPVDGIAAWWCRGGAHVVGAIGSLP